jgi:hypothetical protein
VFDERVERGELRSDRGVAPIELAQVLERIHRAIQPGRGMTYDAPISRP